MFTPRLWKTARGETEASGRRPAESDRGLLAVSLTLTPEPMSFLVGRTVVSVRPMNAEEISDQPGGWSELGPAPTVLVFDDGSLVWATNDVSGAHPGVLFGELPSGDTVIVRAKRSKKGPEVAEAVDPSTMRMGGADKRSHIPPEPLQLHQSNAQPAAQVQPESSGEDGRATVEAVDAAMHAAEEAAGLALAMATAAAESKVAAAMAEAQSQAAQQAASEAAAERARALAAAQAEAVALEHARALVAASDAKVNATPSVIPGLHIAPPFTGLCALLSSNRRPRWRPRPRLRPRLQLRGSWLRPRPKSRPMLQLRGSSIGKQPWNNPK